MLAAAARTGKWVNIKKGQFAGPDAMKHAMQKCVDCGNDRVMLTDRGNMFGYGDMVVDFRNIPQMQQFGAPVIMDITHSLQQPNQSSGVTGGKPELIETIAKAAIAVGCDGLFIETHPDPSVPPDMERSLARSSSGFSAGAASPPSAGAAASPSAPGFAFTGRAGLAGRSFLGAFFGIKMYSASVK